MRILLSLTCLIAASCTSDIPEECYSSVGDDVEWFTAALLDRRVETVIKHFHKTGTKNPVQESLKLFKRETEFYEIWNTRTSQEYAVYEENGKLIAESSFPSGKVLKMIWLDGNWYYQSFDFRE